MSIVFSKEAFDKHTETVYRKIQIPPFLESTIDDEQNIKYILDVKKAFRGGYINKNKILSDFMEFTRKILAIEDIDVRVINFDVDYIDEFISEINEMDKRLSKVTFDRSLSLISKHFKLGNLSLNCWDHGYGDSEGRIKRRIRHPIYYLEDIKKIRSKGLKIRVSGNVKQRLETLRIDEERKNNTVYLREAPDGFYIFVYELRDALIMEVQKKAKITYNENRDGELVSTKLSYINNVGSDVIESFPDEMAEFCDSGFSVYACRMFILPTIIQLLRERGVGVIDGAEEIYPKFEPLTFPMNKVEDHPDYRGFEFQDEALEAWEKAGRLGTIALPTGSGKTVIAIRAIERVRLPTLIVTPTIEMLYQWKNEIIKWLKVREKHVGIYYSDLKEVRDITIITFQSGHRRVRQEFTLTPVDRYGKSNGSKVKTIIVGQSGDLLDEMDRIADKIGFLIMDEGHHSPAPIFQRIMVYLKSIYRMSLTATPYREDKNEALAFLAMGNVVYTKDYASLAKVKIVSPIVFNRVLLDLSDREHSILEKKAKIRANPNMDDESKEILVNEMIEDWEECMFNELQEAINGEMPDYISSRQIRQRTLFAYAESKFDTLAKILDRHKDSKILIFNEFVFGAEAIRYYLYNMEEIDCEYMTGSTKKKDRKKIFNQFKKKKGRSVLITTTVLDEGIDVPDCDVVIIFNGTRSKRQMIQRVGRGCRYQKGKIEYVYELVACPLQYLKKNIGRDSSRWWEVGKDVNYIIERMRKRYHNRGRIGYDDRMYGRFEEVTINEFKLYEFEVSDYRNIKEVINPEEMEKLIAEMRMEETIKKAEEEDKLTIKKMEMEVKDEF